MQTHSCMRGPKTSGPVESLASTEKPPGTITEVNFPGHLSLSHLAYDTPGLAFQQIFLLSRWLKDFSC